MHASKPLASLGNCPWKYCFHGISASIDSSHFGEKSANKGDAGMWQATDGRAVSDPKTNIYMFGTLPTWQKIFQDIIPKIALLEIF